MGEAELYAGRRREADDVTNLNQINSQRQLLRVFGGLNEGYACSEAELSEEKNFSSRGCSTGRVEVHCQAGHQGAFPERF